MRILLFSRPVFPEESFVTHQIGCLCEDLVAHHGAEATLISPRIRPPLPSPLGFHHVRTLSTRFSRKTIPGRFLNSLTYFVCAMLLGFRGKSPDVVISLSDAPSAALPAWLWCRLRGAKLVILSQEIFPQTGVMLGRVRSTVAYEILDWIGWFLLYVADAVVTPDESIRERLIALKRIDPSKVSVIRNGVDTSRYVPGPTENAFRQKHNLSGKFVIMHSGHVGAAQDLPTLVDAAVLLKDYADLLVVIVGEGDGKAVLQARASSLQLNNVVFLPFQARSDMPESLAAADVFVISMKAELIGYIVPSRLYDVLAAGRTYVAAFEPESEIAALTAKYECGLMARPGDARDLADKLLEFYQNYEWVNWRGNNARTAAVEYDRRHQAEKFAELFAGIRGSGSWGVK